MQYLKVSIVHLEKTKVLKIRRVTKWLAVADREQAAGDVIAGVVGVEPLAIGARAGAEGIGALATGATDREAVGGETERNVARGAVL